MRCPHSQSRKAAGRFRPPAHSPGAPAVSTMEIWLRSFSGLSRVSSALVPGRGCHATIMSLLRHGRGHGGMWASEAVQQGGRVRWGEGQGAAGSWSWARLAWPATGLLPSTAARPTRRTRMHMQADCKLRELTAGRSWCCRAAPLDTPLCCGTPCRPGSAAGSNRCKGAIRSMRTLMSHSPLPRHTLSLVLFSQGVQERDDLTVGAAAQRQA